MASSSPAINNNVQNRKGLDFSITARKQFGQVYAELGLVGTYLKTEWKKYDEVKDAIGSHRNSPGELMHEGQPLDALWGYKCLGFYTIDDFNVTNDDKW